MSRQATSAPCRARDSAVARPMPRGRAAPVTSATTPSNMLEMLDKVTPVAKGGPAVYGEIIYVVEDPVATSTLNRPDALNAWTQRMAAEVRHAVAEAEADPAVVGIVITGAGRAFCAGADMNNLATL